MNDPSQHADPKRSISEQSARYEVRVRGHLDAHWAGWFGGLTITREANGDTLVTGPALDQSAVFALLKKVRDAGMLLVSVIRVEPGAAGSADN